MDPNQNIFFVLIVFTYRTVCSKILSCMILSIDNYIFTLYHFRHTPRIHSAYIQIKLQLFQNHFRPEYLPHTNAPTSVVYALQTHDLPVSAYSEKKHMRKILSRLLQLLAVVDSIFWDLVSLLYKAWILGFLIYKFVFGTYICKHRNTNRQFFLICSICLILVD